MLAARRFHRSFGIIVIHIGQKIVNEQEEAYSKTIESQGYASDTFPFTRVQVCFGPTRLFLITSSFLSRLAVLSSHSGGWGFSLDVRSHMISSYADPKIL